MGCYEEKDFLDYLRDEMSIEKIEDFERHIEECDQCAILLGELHEAVVLWGR